MLIKSIAIVAPLLAFSTIVNATYFWQLDSLEANGDINYSDDFSDGLLNVLPTSRLSVFLGTVTESGGSLQFTDSDGAGVSSIPSPGTLRDTVLLDSIIPDNGLGTTWTGSFIPNLLSLTTLPIGSGYGVQINNAGNPNFEQATLAVVSDGNGNTGVGLFDSLNNLVDSALINAITGNIVLSLHADPVNDLVTGSYSIDGGSSFNALSNSISISGDLRAWAFGQATTVPVPAQECDIQMNQATYIDGDTVTANVFRIANQTTNPIATEMKVWLGAPGIPPISLINVGSDGSLVFPVGTDVDLGPVPLLPVSAALPRGNYQLNCRLLDPITGSLFWENLNNFDIQ